jgi:hypothetical protein
LISLLLDLLAVQPADRPLSAALAASAPAQKRARFVAGLALLAKETSRRVRAGSHCHASAILSAFRRGTSGGARLHLARRAAVEPRREMSGELVCEPIAADLARVVNYRGMGAAAKREEHVCSFDPSAQRRARPTCST